MYQTPKEYSLTQKHEHTPWHRVTKLLCAITKDQWSSLKSLPDKMVSPGDKKRLFILERRNEAIDWWHHKWLKSARLLCADVSKWRKLALMSYVAKFQCKQPSTFHRDIRECEWNLEVRFKTSPYITDKQMEDYYASQYGK